MSHSFFRLCGYYRFSPGVSFRAIYKAGPGARSLAFRDREWKPASCTVLKWRSHKDFAGNCAIIRNWHKINILISTAAHDNSSRSEPAKESSSDGSRKPTYGVCCRPGGLGFAGGCRGGWLAGPVCLGWLWAYGPNRRWFWWCRLPPVPTRSPVEKILSSPKSNNIL